jgi:hypothetical protein
MLDLSKYEYDCGCVEEHKRYLRPEQVRFMNDRKLILAELRAARAKRAIKKMVRASGRKWEPNGETMNHEWEWKSPKT